MPSSIAFPSSEETKSDAVNDLVSNSVFTVHSSIAFPSSEEAKSDGIDDPLSNSVSCETTSFKTKTYMPD